MKAFDGELAKSRNADIASVRASLAAGTKAVGECVDYIVATAGTDIKAAFAGAVPFLKLMGIVCGGWQMARAALVAERKLAAGSGDAAFYRAKIATTRFYADHMLVQAAGLADTMVKGSAGVMAVPGEDMLAA
jgi:microcompartment protein CcmL/EutN